ncbi:MAG TPA: shikimate dehydrogenase [Jatrophihabitans sp.]|nr:shikimate dehydrogenase [Jatrophihabitans sp.]
MPLAESVERWAAVLGSPISHSLSPVLHRAAYAALGLNWTYRAIECAEDDLAGLLAGADAGVAGFSCTMPLKRRLLELADTASPRARAIGAGNTLLPRPDGWHAENTDVDGIRAALAERDVPAGGQVLLLGAGGTAQAALAALDPDAQVTVLIRDPSRAGPLRQTADRLAVPVTVAALSDLPERLAAADLVLSTLPPGAADPLVGVPGWRAGQALLDVVYADWPTPLARVAAQAGAVTVSGASMLLFQAVRQVELMTGSAAPVAAMRAALRAAAGPGCTA